jgi:hypothetical protein
LDRLGSILQLNKEAFLLASIIPGQVNGARFLKQAGEAWPETFNAQHSTLNFEQRRTRVRPWAFNVKC